MQSFLLGDEVRHLGPLDALGLGVVVQIGLPLEVSGNVSLSRAILSSMAWRPAFDSGQRSQRLPRAQAFLSSGFSAAAFLWLGLLGHNQSLGRSLSLLFTGKTDSVTSA